MTGTHTRFAQKEVLDPFDLTRLSTKDLLGEDRDADYFGPSNTSCLAVFDTGQLTGIIDALEGDAPPLAEPPTSKAAVIDFTIDTINSTHIFHLLSQGCDQTLLELKPLFEHLQKTDSQKLLRLALARSTDKDFGLCYALHMGHAKAIEVFKELLMTVPVEKRASLLQRATQNGLALALQSGHADAVLAYAELIELVPEGEDRLALLMAISPEGITLAMQNGHAPAIRACATLMQALTPEHRAILLTKIAGEGTTLALRNGHMDALIEYAKILTSIPAHNRLALLIPGDPTQRDALIESLRDAKSSQIRTFLQILLKFSALNTPGALVEYVNLVREAIPDDAREGLKNTPTDNRLQFLFAGAQDEGLIVSAFDSAAAQDKEALLNMWQEFGLTDSFVLAMSSFVS
jgi:hypothetical protein